MDTNWNVLYLLCSAQKPSVNANRQKLFCIKKDKCMLLVLVHLVMISVYSTVRRRNEAHTIFLSTIDNTTQFNTVYIFIQECLAIFLYGAIVFIYIHRWFSQKCTKTKQKKKGKKKKNNNKFIIVSVFIVYFLAESIEQASVTDHFNFMQIYLEFNSKWLYIKLEQFY